MIAPPVLPLSRSRKALLAAAGLGVCATPVAAALVTAPAIKQTSGTAVSAVMSTLAAPAQTLAAQAVAVPPASASAEDDRPASPISLAQNAAIVDPQRVVGRMDVSPLALVEGAPAQLAELAAVRSRASDPSPPSASPGSSTQAAPAGDAYAQAWSFVRSYAASTGLSADRRFVVRWPTNICVVVEGVAPAQASAMEARIIAVAKAAGLYDDPSHLIGPWRAYKSKCRTPNLLVEITDDPQRMFDEMAARRPKLKLAQTSAGGPAATVSQPVQAWYLTFGPVDIGDLQADPDRRFLQDVLIIVDGRRMNGVRPAVLADYLAMVGLSQPRELGRCNALPSVTDLFARPCDGRAAPTGLTRADSAYLAALYANTQEIEAESKQSKVAADMAQVLIDDRLASR